MTYGAAIWLSKPHALIGIPPGMTTALRSAPEGWYVVVLFNPSNLQVTRELHRCTSDLSYSRELDLAARNRCRRRAMLEQLVVSVFYHLV